MLSVLKTALLLGAVAILAGTIVSVGFFVPSDTTPLTPWLLLGIVLAIWALALVVGLKFSRSSGWVIAGAGCLIGGIAMMAYGRAQSSLFPVLAGTAAVMLSIMFTLLRDRFPRKLT